MKKSIIAILSGMYIVFKHLFKKPITREYPEIHPTLPEKMRGKHELKGCIGCGICTRVCPANAITIIKKDKDVVSYKIDLNKCIFCGNCQFHCPVSAIKMTKEFELGTDNKESLILELHAKKEDI